MEFHLYPREPGSLRIAAYGIDMAPEYRLVKQHHEYNHKDCIQHHSIGDDPSQGLGTKVGPELGNRASRCSVGIYVIKPPQHLPRAKGDDESLNPSAHDDTAVNQANNKAE